MSSFLTERDGQIEFFTQFGIDYVNNPVLIDNTDGVYNGCLFEFKLHINDVNSVLFQAIKYLSKMRIKGESVPSQIILISLNDDYALVFNSDDYRNDIEKVYIGAASRNNQGFVASTNGLKLQYGSDDSSIATHDTIELKRILRITSYFKVTIDEDDICGWAERYYRELPNASKGEFLGDNQGQVRITGEIRNPVHFRNLILPYTGQTNEKFKYLMDKLNDRLKKKDLGAFYTPMPYAQKAAELVLKAIDRVPEGNDYIILDRCAGTGNLEDALKGLIDQNGDDVLSHCVLSTYEYYEYKVLQERLGADVRFIIPPTESLVQYSNGCIINADALSEDYINNSEIKRYIDDDRCTIILLENPPYRDDTSGMTGIRSSERASNSFVEDQMALERIPKRNEIANRFIWSAFKYYLRQETDSYIVFSPIKYWKADKLIDKKLLNGFVFNRKFFHASPSAITCILWSNEDAVENNYYLDIYDLDNNGQLVYMNNIKLERTYNSISVLFDRVQKDTDTVSHVWSKTDGAPIIKDETSYDNDDIVGFILGLGYGISNPNLNFNLTRFRPIVKNSFCELRKDTYMNYLPILALKHYLMFERRWFEMEFVFCCGDDPTFAFRNDTDFIKSCFIFGMLDYYNKCLSVSLPDGSVYLNELCFDGLHHRTVALCDLSRFSLDDNENDLIDLWDRILCEASRTSNYNPSFTYGTYQIVKELNTYTKDDRDNKVYDYPILNGNIESLRAKLKEYFKNYITPKLYLYKLIK